VTRRLALVLTLAVFAPPAVAQTRVGARVGLALSSVLVRDSITQPLAARSNLAPAIGFWFDNRLGSTYRLDLGLTMAWSRLRQRGPNGAREIVPLTLWSPTLSLSRTVIPGVTARATVGAMIYDPDRTRATLFSKGSPVLPLVGAGITVERPLKDGLLLTADLGYDLHRFTTTTLRNQGFVGERLVHRAMLSLGLSRAL